MKIMNPIFNASHELVAFDGILRDAKNQAVLTDQHTVELIEEVKKLPRLYTYDGGNQVRVEVDGATYTLSYKFYTDQEKLTYKNYRDQHKGNGGVSGTKSKLPESLLEFLLKTENFKKLDAESQAFVESAKPRSPEEIALKKMGFDDETIVKILAMKKA